MLASLGDFKFETDTAAYDNVKRKTNYRWAKQARIARRPATQFLGIGEESITLSGVIYPEYKGGLNQINQMRTLAGDGNALDLYFAHGGVGSVMGKWCIVSIDEGQQYFHGDGQPRKQEFTIELIYYGDDQA